MSDSRTMRAVISDIRQASISANSVSFATDVKSFTDYYAFGWAMPGRTFSAGEYRYGFNGKESAPELYGEGASYDFGARWMDARLGRWGSGDPLEAKYPNSSPFVFCFNSPLIFIDPNGKEVITPNGLKVLKRTIDGKTEFYAVNQNGVETEMDAATRFYLDAVQSNEVTAKIIENAINMKSTYTSIETSERISFDRIATITYHPGRSAGAVTASGSLESHNAAEHDYRMKSADINIYASAYYDLRDAVFKGKTKSALAKSFAKSVQTANTESELWKYKTYSFRVIKPILLACLPNEKAVAQVLTLEEVERHFNQERTDQGDMYFFQSTIEPFVQKYYPKSYELYKQKVNEYLNNTSNFGVDEWRNGISKQDGKRKHRSDTSE